VRVKARAGREQASHARMLVGGVVLHGQIDLEALRHGGVEISR
jgi:hypothetical protein